MPDVASGIAGRTRFVVASTRAAATLAVAACAVACAQAPSSPRALVRAGVDLPSAAPAWRPEEPATVWVVSGAEATLSGSRRRMRVEALPAADDPARGLYWEGFATALAEARDPAASRVTAAFDGAVPYRMVLSSVYTAGLQGVSEFELLVERPDGSPGAIRLCPPAETPGGLEASAWCMGRGDRGQDLAGMVRIPDPEGQVADHVVVSRDGAVLVVEKRGGMTPIPARDGAPDLDALDAVLADLRASEPGEIRLDVLADRVVPWAWVAAVLGVAQAGTDGDPRFPMVMIAAS